MEPTCSHPECSELPVFEILPRGSAPGGATRACRDHVGTLLLIDPEAEGPQEWSVHALAAVAPEASE